MHARVYISQSEVNESDVMSCDLHLIDDSISTKWRIQFHSYGWWTWTMDIRCCLLFLDIRSSH